MNAGLKIREPLNLPPLHVSNRMRYIPTVPVEYLHVSNYDVTISTINLRHYLAHPDELVHALNKAMVESHELQQGTSYWQTDK